MAQNIVYITRRERFAAAHKLFNPSWSDSKNKEVFGKCANPNWHGHNYTLWITVKGPVDPVTGFVMDLRFLSDLVQERVIEELDHKNVNLDTSFMKGKMASTENICLGIWQQIAGPISEKGATLHSIKLEETENNFVEYYGE